MFGQRTWERRQEEQREAQRRVALEQVRIRLGMPAGIRDQEAWMVERIHELEAQVHTLERHQARNVYTIPHFRAAAGTHLDEATSQWVYRPAVLGETTSDWTWDAADALDPSSYPEDDYNT